MELNDDPVFSKEESTRDGMHNSSHPLPHNCVEKHILLQLKKIVTEEIELIRGE